MEAQTVSPSLALKRRIKAAPAKVFAAWTVPQLMMGWWGPAGAKVLEAEADLRLGGRYRIRFTAPNGEEHEVGGVYREIVQDRRLVFTWAWRSTPERESLVSLGFAADGEGTLLTLTHERFFDEPARDRHRLGWTSTLDSLERFLA